MEKTEDVFLAIVELYNNKNKTTAVATFSDGTEETIDWADNNKRQKILSKSVTSTRVIDKRIRRN